VVFRASAGQKRCPRRAPGSSGMLNMSAVYLSELRESRSPRRDGELEWTDTCNLSARTETEEDSRRRGCANPLAIHNDTSAGAVMNWRAPEFDEIKMDAEVGSYQPDTEPTPEFHNVPSDGDIDEPHRAPMNVPAH
jgi:hypothetical protein